MNTRLESIVMDETHLVLTSVLPLVMKGVLSQTGTDEWPAMIAHAIMWIAAYETFDPGEFLGAVQVELDALLPEAVQRFDAKEARRSELQALVDGLHLASDQRLKLMNAMML